MVVAAGLGLQRRLRRRRAKVARQGALTAAVTAVVALAGLWAVSAQMLVSSHDLAVVLASLPVAAGAGVAYGVATARQVAADLEALAATARRLEAGDLAARARVQGTAEVALIAETLNAAAARLAEARERERRMEQGRRDLIAWASHDLRTPLASLRALAEALADDLAPDEATRRRYLAGLTANVERLSALVDDLFELAAIQAGAVSLQLEPTSLPELASEVVDRFEPEAAAAGVRLECQLDGDRPVLAGRDQLGRVLANLVVNGIRHTPSGGVLRVAVADDDGTAILQVTDSCGGIPEADLPRVFDQLWRGDPARSTNGAGLGLAIARGLVDAHGGTIGVANVPGGCEFTVRLPLATGAPTANGQRQPFGSLIDSLQAGNADLQPPPVLLGWPHGPDLHLSGQERTGYRDTRCRARPAVRHLPADGAAVAPDPAAARLVRLAEPARLAVPVDPGLARVLRHRGHPGAAGQALVGLPAPLALAASPRGRPRDRAGVDRPAARRGTFAAGHRADEHRLLVRLGLRLHQDPLLDGLDRDRGADRPPLGQAPRAAPHPGQAARRGRCGR